MAQRSNSLLALSQWRSYHTAAQLLFSVALSSALSLYQSHINLLGCVIKAWTVSHRRSDDREERMDLPRFVHLHDCQESKSGFCVSVQVNELSSEAQKVIHSYTDGQPGQVGKYASLCAASSILPWRPPTAQDHNTLLKACSSHLICCVVPHVPSSS